MRAPSAHLEDLTSALVDFVSHYPVQPGQRLQQNGGCMGLRVLCVIFESVKRQHISFTYVCMYMCMYVRTFTQTHTFMHMCVNPTLQCTAARTGESSNHELSAPAAASCFPSTQL